MSERLVVVHNPNSTGARAVRGEVLNRLDDQSVSYVLMETQSPDYQDNVNLVADTARDGDTFLALGGDGTHAPVAEGVILSGMSDISVGFDGYGNFNDIAKGYNGPGRIDPMRFLDSHASVVDAKPLHVDVDGKTIRRPLAYATLGWTATASGKFAAGEFREHLKNRNKHLISALSMRALFLEYWRRRDEIHLPRYTLGDGREYHYSTDVVALNHPRMGRVIRRNDFDPSGDEFGFVELDVSNLAKNSPFLTKAFMGRMPAQFTSEQQLHFHEPVSLPYQNEGEFMEIKDVTTLTITKNHSDVVRVIRPARRSN